MANAPQLTVGLGFDLDEASARKVVKGMERLGEYLEKSSEEQSKKVSKNWQDSFATMVKGFIAVEVAGRAWGFAKDLIMLEERFKNMQMPLKNLTEQTGDFSNSMFFLKGLANDLGQDIFTLSDAYKGVYASGKQAGMSTESLNDIFQSMVRSGSALKLSNEKIELSMKAIEQMMNKGVIGSEELRQQLGDHLPGAYALMAKAAKDAGLSVSGSTAELGKLLEDGKLASNVVLPFFAKRMEEAFGKNAEANVNTLSGSANRLKNELTYLVTALDDSVITSFWSKFQNGLADVFKYMTYISKTGTWKDFIQFFTGGTNLGNVAQMVGSESRVQKFASLPREKQMPIIKQKNEDLRSAERAYNSNIAAGIKMDKSAILKQQLEYQNFLGALKSLDKGGTPTVTPNSGKGTSEKARNLAIDLAEIAQKSKDAAEQLAKVNEKIAEFNFQQGRKATPLGQASMLKNTTESNKEKGSFFNDMLGISGIDLKESENALKEKFEALKGRIQPTITSFGLGLSEDMSLALSYVTDAMNISFNFLGDTLSNAFASIFNKDIKFDFKKLLGQFLEGLGSMVMQMAVQLKAVAALKTKIEIALASVGGEGFALAGAIGLFALGAAMKGGGMALSQSGNQSPSQSQQYNSTFTAPVQGSSNQSNKVEFVIQGTTLKGVLNNVNNSFG